MSEPTTHVLGPASALGENEARGFDIETADGMRKIIAVRWQGSVLGYLNRCPHAGTPLNWMPDDFFDHENKLLVCQTHGAYFEPDTGFCVDGPCAGDSLQSVSVSIVGDDLVLTI